jgi:hypothetical protein
MEDAMNVDFADLADLPNPAIRLADQPEPDFWEVASAFLYEIDWTEPWLMGLVIFHVVTFCLILMLRQHEYIQAGIFVTIGLLALSAEHLNEWAAANWKSFAGQQYFDSSGVFISVVLSCPIIVNGLLVVLMWLKGASTMLVKVKRAQLRKQAKSAKGSGGSNKKKDN